MKKIICILILALISTLYTFSESPFYLSWLELDNQFGNRWSWQDGGYNLEGRLYSSSAISNPDNRILILCAKKSSSYILAFNSILEVIEDRLPSTEFYFYNFNKDFDQADRIVNSGIMEEIDLVIAMGSEGMIYASENLEGLNIPVVTCINKDPVLLGYLNDYKSGSGTNIAYTSVNVPLNVNIEWIYKIKPELKAITILYDPDHSSVVASEVRPLIAELQVNGIDTFDGGVASGETLEEDLSSTIQQGLEYMNSVDPGLENSLFWITSSTNIFSELEIISANTGNVPVASSVPNTVNETENSAMVAIGIDRRNSANLAALYVVDILLGYSSPGDLPVGVVTPPDISINFQTAERIGESIPFEIFENASFIYGYEGTLLRSFGLTVNGEGR